MLRLNLVTFHQLCSLHTGEVRKLFLKLINIHHLQMACVSGQRFSIIQNQWRKVRFWHEPRRKQRYSSGGFFFLIKPICHISTIGGEVSALLVIMWLAVTRPNTQSTKLSTGLWVATDKPLLPRHSLKLFLMICHWLSRQPAIERRNKFKPF